MRKPKFLDVSLLKFLLVGAGNTLLSAALMFALEGLGYWPSTAIAYIAGSVMSFFLNRSFTFHSSETLWRSALKFAVNVAVCYAAAYGIAQPLVKWLLNHLNGSAISPLWRERCTKVAGMGLFTLLNYFGQRFFAFRT